MDGVININKPLGMTSHDVVSRLRRILGIKKIGHTGTLDPDASGVLPMCIGKGTKLAEYLTATDKCYMAQMTLGAFTDTQDGSGEILESFSVDVSEEEIINAVNSFIGEIEQIPPMYSAIKINGKKLYELAREGKSIEREARKVTINDIEIKGIDLKEKKVDMLVSCSKGTYIRTLCNDIGARLGCGGYMSALERTKSGRFSIENSFKLDEIESMTEKADFGFMMPLSEVLSEYKKIVLAEKNAKRLQNGIKINVEGLEENERYRVFDEQGSFLALAESQRGQFVVLKTFYGGADK